MSHAQKSVLVISSHVIRGSVGSRASVNALEQMGFPVWSMLTVSMPWQPEHGPSHRLIVGEQDFQAWADDILRSDWCCEIGAVLTGYFASAKQVEIAARLVAALKQKNPNLLYFCDPIMGDENGLYVQEDIAQAIVTDLLPQADIAKPNRSELEWICGHKLETSQQIIKAAKSLNIATVLVTSAWPLLKNSIGNLLVSQNQILLAEHNRVEKPVSGLGDMTAALFLARRLLGDREEDALRSATASVYALLHDTVMQGAYELLLETGRHILSNPTTHVVIRHLNDQTKKHTMKVKPL